MSENSNNKPTDNIVSGAFASPQNESSFEKKHRASVRKNNIFMLGVAAAVLVGYGALSVVVSSSSSEDPATPVAAPTQVSQEQETSNESLDILSSMDVELPASIKLPKGVEKADGGYVFGDPNAEIAVEVWADFQCPYCANFDSDAAEPLTFAENNGAIRNEYYYAAFLSPGSLVSANALGCAADQDKFKEFKSFAYNLQTTQPGEFTEDILVNAGKEIGIPDQDAYEVCVSEGTYNDYVLASTDLMPQRGVGGTPTVFVDGENVFQSGISFEDFLTRIGLNVVSEE